MSNEKQIAIGSIAYRRAHRRLPSSNYFIDDFTVEYESGYLKSLEVFQCPGTGEFRVDDTNKLNGSTSYMKSGNFFSEDVELSGGGNSGFGNNPYDIDPSNPQFDKWANGKLTEYGIYDRGDFHEGRINFMSYESMTGRVISDTSVFWSLTKQRTVDKKDQAEP
jgi:hypothetical protein